MGSCGTLSVSFYHYIKDSVAFAGLAKSVTSFYDCYGYKLQRPSRGKLFEEIDRLKTSLNRQITSSPAQDERNRQKSFFSQFHGLPNDDEIQDSYGL